MPRKARAKAAAVPPTTSLESEKENVADGASAPNPKSPPMRAAAAKGLNTSRNWEEELEAMTQKLKKISLEKEEAQRRVEEQEAIIKQQQEQIESKDKEQDKLQEKLKKLGKLKPFQPVLTTPLPDVSSEDESKKKKNDPDRLKRPASAYLLWSNDNRAKVRSENPGAGFTEIAAILSEMWKKVSDEEKRKYEEEYQKNKAVYNMEASKQKRDAEGIHLLQTEQNKQCAMEVYEQFLQYQKEIASDGKGKKKEKDPEKPKKSATSYFVFCRERRPALMAENHKATQIAKILGEEWKKLDAEARAPYEKVAAEEKAIYLEEIEEYNQKKAEESKLVDEEAKERAEMDRICGLQLLKKKEKEQELKKTLKASKAPRKAKAKSTEGNKEKPKRPPTAYALFGKEYREKIKSQKPNASFGEINSLTSAKWKEMSADEKKPYAEQAAEAKENMKNEVDNSRLGPDNEDEGATSSEQ